jgi:hypothetical protein
MDNNDLLARLKTIDARNLDREELHALERVYTGDASPLHRSIAEAVAVREGK